MKEHPSDLHQYVNNLVYNNRHSTPNNINIYMYILIPIIIFSILLYIKPKFIQRCNKDSNIVSIDIISLILYVIIFSIIVNMIIYLYYKNI